MTTKTFADGLERWGQQQILVPEGARVVPMRTVHATYATIFAADGSGALLERPYRASRERQPEWDAQRRDFSDHTVEETFSHELDAEKLAAMSDDELVEHFKGTVNAQLDDPFYFDGDMADEDITFESGSYDELERLIRIFAITDPEMGTDRAKVMIRTEDEEEYARLEGEDTSLDSDRFAHLLEIALKLHRPYGRRLEYNDGAYDRQSGFDWYPQYLSFEIDPASAHERLEAISALRSWVDGLKPQHKAMVEALI